MRISIMQPGYLPWLGFFELMHNCDLFVLLDDVQYTKKDWRNRNKIRTNKGWAWITVPTLTKRNRFQLINEVKINNSVNWSRKHTASIKIHYGRSRYFNHYYYTLEKIYARSWKFLLDLDVALITYLKDKLGIKTPLIKSSELLVAGKREEKIINICKKLGASELYDSHAASTFLDRSMFKEQNITLEFQNYVHPVYNQQYDGFVSNLSTIDLIFNHGPDSLSIILNKF